MECFSKRDILNKLPTISESTVEVTLNKLVEEKYILKIGNTRGAKYIRNMERIIPSFI